MTPFEAIREGSGIVLPPLSGVAISEGSERGFRRGLGERAEDRCPAKKLSHLFIRSDQGKEPSNDYSKRAEVQ